MKPKEQRAAARKKVIDDLASDVEERHEIAQSHLASHYAPYRREIARLWAIALRAVKAAK